MALLGQAMNRLAQEYLAQGKTTTFEALNAFLEPSNSGELPTYEDVADQLKISAGSVKTLIHRLRKQYSAFVREEISRTSKKERIFPFDRSTRLSVLRSIRWRKKP
jgi:hypothetical protein